MKPVLVVALDVPTESAMREAVRRLPPDVRWVKVGLELFTAVGPKLVETLVAEGREVFLDLKLHDIPRTVANAVACAGGLGARLMTVHALGGRAMLEAAAESARALGARRPQLVAVTTLTSMSQDDLSQVGIVRSLPEQAVALARLAIGAGVDGVVTSVHEAAALRAALGPECLLVTPGIRPAGAGLGDQKRVATPALAVAAGATHLVVGRPILEAADPAGAARAILAEMDVRQG